MGNPFPGRSKCSHQYRRGRGLLDWPMEPESATDIAQNEQDLNRSDTGMLPFVQEALDLSRWTAARQLAVRDHDGLMFSWLHDGLPRNRSLGSLSSQDPVHFAGSFQGQWLTDVHSERRPGCRDLNLRGINAQHSLECTVVVISKGIDNQAR